MKVYTKIVMQWNGSNYTTLHSEGFEYNGQVALCCGASPMQNQIAAEQSNFYNTMSNQAAEVFGNSSTVFNDLMNTFSPTVAAGPNQQGFSPTENANLKSEAITQTGQSYANAKAAVGDAEAAQNGGNVDLPSGSKVGEDVGLATSAANQTAGELSQITEANYETGRKNYDTAVAGMESAPGVFGAATSAGNAATGAGEAASNTANQIAQENNSWVQGVTGALGTIAGAAIPHLIPQRGSGNDNSDNTDNSN